MHFSLRWKRHYRLRGRIQLKFDWHTNAGTLLSVCFDSSVIAWALWGFYWRQVEFQVLHQVVEVLAELQDGVWLQRDFSFTLGELGRLIVVGMRLET